MASRGKKKETLYSLMRAQPKIAADFEIYKKTVLGGSHRSSAIMACSFLENTLFEILCAAFQELNQEDIDELFFGRHSVLGALSSKTDICFAMGLISRKERLEIDTIRRIRNAFAHATVELTFDNPLIVKELAKLDYMITDNGVKSLSHYRELYVGLCFTLVSETSKRNIIKELAKQGHNVSRDELETLLRKLEK